MSLQGHSRILSMRTSSCLSFVLILTCFHTTKQKPVFSSTGLKHQLDFLKSLGISIYPKEKQLLKTIIKHWKTLSEKNRGLLIFLSRFFFIDSKFGKCFISTFYENSYYMYDLFWRNLTCNTVNSCKYIYEQRIFRQRMLYSVNQCEAKTLHLPESTCKLIWNITTHMRVMIKMIVKHWFWSHVNTINCSSINHKTM